MGEATDFEVQRLRKEVDDLKRAVLHMFQLLTGQRVNEIELRALIERLGATTRTKIPDGVKL